MPTREQLQTRYRELPLGVLFGLASDPAGLTAEALEALHGEFDRRGVVMEHPDAESGPETTPDGLPSSPVSLPLTLYLSRHEEHARRHRRLTIAVLALTTAVEAGIFGVSFGHGLPTEFAEPVSAGAFHAVMGGVAGALVGLAVGSWWVRSLRGARLYEAFALGVVVYVPCGLLTLAMSTVVLGQTQGFWSAAMTFIDGIAFGLPFILGGGLAAGAAYFLLATDEPPV